MPTDNQPSMDAIAGNIVPPQSTAKTTDGMGILAELTWAVLDGHATDVEVEALERLLTDSAESRETYLQCAQLHADLYALLGGTSQ